MIMTTTLISRRTPRPLAVIPKIISIQESPTIMASKVLNASIKNMPLEAKVLRPISKAKTLRNMKSIKFIVDLLTWINSVKPRSKRMKTEYALIVKNEMNSTVLCSKVLRQFYCSSGRAFSRLSDLTVGSIYSFSFSFRNPNRLTTTR